MTLETLQLAMSVTCVVAILVAVGSGVASLMLARSIDQHRQRELASFLKEVRNRMLVIARSGPATAQLVARPVRPDLPQRLPDMAPRLIPAPASGSPARLAAVASGDGQAPPAASSDNVVVHPARLSRATGPRVITPDQRERMIRLLGLSPDHVLIASDGSAESEVFADQLADVFHAAGWTIDRALSVGQAPSSPLSGYLGEGGPQQVAAAAFAAAGLTLKPRAGPGGQGREIVIGPLSQEATARAAS